MDDEAETVADFIKAEIPNKGDVTKRNGYVIRNLGRFGEGPALSAEDEALVADFAGALGIRDETRLGDDRAGPATE